MADQGCCSWTIPRVRSVTTPIIYLLLLMTGERASYTTPEQPANARQLVIITTLDSLVSKVAADRCPREKN